MGDEKDAFYVVWKGDTIGVYKSINDFQSILQSSVIFLFHFSVPRILPAFRLI